VIADAQTEGRGRYGRVFHSPKQEGVYLSVLWKPGGLGQDTRLLTVLAAAAVSKAIERTCGLRADIKWVNDIFCNGKKLCGILAEGVASGDRSRIDGVIMGVGVNTGLVPPEVADIATSIEKETGKRGVRNQLIAEVLNRLEAALLDGCEADKRRDLLAYYTDRLWIVGGQVQVMGMGEPYAATVLGIDQDGALRVRDGGGTVRLVTTGEIKLAERAV